MCTNHIWFVHSSVSGRLGCFHLLVIVNSTSVNVVEQTAVWVRLLPVLWGVFPEVALLDCVEGLCLISEEPLICFISVLFSVPPRVQNDCNVFVYIPVDIAVFWFFWQQSSSWVQSGSSSELLLSSEGHDLEATALLWVLLSGRPLLPALFSSITPLLVWESYPVDQAENLLFHL